MARKGENIYKRKDGRWEARYINGRKENGRAIYKSVYAHSYREVKAKRNKMLKEREELDFEGQKKAGTLETVAEGWIKSKENSWKISTKCRYREKLDTYILPEFGKRSVSDISTKEIEDFLVMLQSKGYNGRKALGSSAASMVLTIFRQIQLQAKKSDCQVRYSAECISVRHKKSNHEVLSEAEEKRLVAKLENDTDETDVGVLTGLFTGARIGEVCALKCDNIDLEGGVIHIRETMQRLPNFSDGKKKTMISIDIPKSDSSNRDIPLNKKLIELLRPFIKPGAFLLTGDKSKFIEPRTLENRFGAILKKCGLKHSGFHLTRRTFATRCIERGMNPKTLAEIMGHANVSTTLNIYVSANMREKSEGIDTLSDLFAV